MLENILSNSATTAQRNHILVCDAQGVSTIQARKQELLATGQNHIDLYNLSEEQTDLWPVFERVSTANIVVCGDADLIQMVQDLTGHWPSEQVEFVESQASEIPQVVNTAFEVTLAKSGLHIHVDAELSLLEALRFEGVELASSCESGTCGTCKTRLISGCADHRDHVLRPDERDSFIMPCVSRAQAGQVLVLQL